MELISLPKWIMKVGKKFFVPALMKPLYCSNCGAGWYPRIKRDGEIVLPGTCPVCRTAAWRKKRG